jgi:hypothetical protein
MDFFSVASRVCGDLGSLLPGMTCPLKILTNLSAAGTRCVEVFLRVALDLRRAASSCRNFITELT